MTWSKTGSFTAPTATTLILEEFFNNHLGGIGDWEVSGAQPNARLYIGDHNAGEQDYIHLRAASGSVATLHNSNGASDWTGATGSEGYNASLTTSSLSANTDIWTSDQSPNSFMLWNGSKLRWWWQDCTEWDLYGTPFPDGETSIVIYESNVRGFTNGGAQAINGPPRYAIGSSPYSQGDTLNAHNHALSTIATQQSRSFRTVQGFHFIASSRASVGYCNFSDTLAQSGQSLSSPFSGETTAIMYDGTDYYIRTNTDLAGGAWLMNCGTTEPVL